jgi:hypothetical protein
MHSGQSTPVRMQQEARASPRRPPSALEGVGEEEGSSTHPLMRAAIVADWRGAGFLEHVESRTTPFNSILQAINELLGL